MSDISSINSMNTNALRITGMATGLDTDTMVKQMMAAENMKMDKLKQNQQYTVWRQEAFRDIIKDFRDLRSSYLLIDSPSDTNIIRSGAYSGAKITADSENTVTATALPGAVNGVTKVTVKQIASGAKLVGEKLSSSTSKPITLSTGLSDLGISDGKFDINVGGKIASIDVKSTMTMQDLINSIYNTKIQNSDGTLSDETLYSKIKVTFSELTQNLSIETREMGSAQTLKVFTSGNVTSSKTILDSLKLSGIVQGEKLSDSTTIDTIPGAGTIQLKVDGINQEIPVYSANTIKGVINKIRSLNTNLDANFDESTKQFSIWTKDGRSLEVTSDYASLGLKASPGVARPGKDAIVEITPPGSTTATPVTKTSNSFTIDNVTYNLIKDPAGTEYTVNLTTQANAEDSVKKIKAFIDKYNALVEKVNDKLTEKKDYNYKPLTADQKKEMEEDDIKTWEEKAKKGVLKNDGDLQQILLDMRTAFMSGVDAAGIRLSEIGIDTYGGFESVSKPGQLKIDEAKLKKALEERGDQVMKLFTASEPSDSNLPTTMPAKYTDATKWKEQYKYDNTGIFKRIESIINNSAGKFDSILLKKAGYEGTASEFDNTITEQIKDQDKAISELNRKLYDKQEKYYQMFARLESAMNQMNAQQSWLAQQLGSGQ